MKISVIENLNKRSCDFLIVPCWEGPKVASDGSFPLAKGALDSGDFLGKNGEVAILYPDEKKKERILLLGLGVKDKQHAEGLRRAYASAIQCIRKKKARSCHLIFPKLDQLDLSDGIDAVFEGIFLSNYGFERFKEKSKSSSLLESISVSGLTKVAEKQIARLQVIASAVYFARDLVNDNADDIHPRRLAQEARSLGKNVKTVVLDRKKVESEGLGLLFAVGKGAQEGPCLICAQYRGNPKAKKNIVLVGKGITYDTGGLSLKPTDNMLTMKSDMAGAAAVLATVKLAAELGLKVNVTALVPAAENAIGSMSYKLGDVYRSYNGKTVEILNTDAEGRLVLADAIAYAVKHLEPECIIDIGTLTGAIVIALGEEIAGLFSDDARIVKEMEVASQQTGENIWRLPLHDYTESLKSDIADLVNIGGKEAGSMKCALFLREFADQVPWAHIDIAGPGYLTKPKYYYPTKGTGWGVRLLLDFLEQRQ